jgi:anaerobic ribonucleoside-triphosphate reductase activating protein
MFTARLIHNVKDHYPNIKIFVWTGYKWEDLIHYSDNNPVIMDVLKCIHLLIDGQFDINHRDITLPFRSSSNQRIINVQKTLKEDQIILYNPTEDE